MSTRRGNWISPPHPGDKEDTIFDRNWFRGMCETLTFKVNMQQKQIKKLKRELKRAKKLEEINKEEIRYLRGRNINLEPGGMFSGTEGGEL